MKTLHVTHPVKHHPQRFVSGSLASAGLKRIVSGSAADFQRIGSGSAADRQRIVDGSAADRQRIGSAPAGPRASLVSLRRRRRRRRGGRRRRKGRSLSSSSESNGKSSGGRGVPSPAGSRPGKSRMASQGSSSATGTSTLTTDCTAPIRGPFSGFWRAGARGRWLAGRTSPGGLNELESNT